MTQVSFTVEMGFSGADGGPDGKMGAKKVSVKYTAAFILERRVERNASASSITGTYISGGRLNSLNH